MEPKTAKSTVIYESLRGRILNGQLPPGSRLPSAQMLCAEYHVGLYTARQVVEKLRRDGLIETAPRRAAVVCRALPERPEPEAGEELRAVLARRGDILDVYRTFALLLPGLLTFASQSCALELTPHYRLVTGLIRRGEGSWRAVSGLVKDVLQHSGNLLFGELYAFFEFHGSLSYFMERCPWFGAYFIGPQPEPLPGLLEILADRDPARKYKKLENLYGALHVAVSAVLARLAQETADCPADVRRSVSWEPLCGKRHYYTRIALDLAQRIGTGQYPPGAFLPSEAKLAAQYGVTVTTVRRALEMAGRRGFIRTINGRGAMVLSPTRLNWAAVPQVLADPASRRDALTCLYALQLLTLLAEPVAREIAGTFSAQELDGLEEALALPDQVLPMEVLYLALARHLKLEPLRTLLDETVQLARWGYYFSNSLQSAAARAELNKLAAAALHSLRAGDDSAFARTLGGCCRFLLNSVRDYMVHEYDLQEGAAVRTPETVLRAP